jgi:hypothetical protein
MSDEKSGLVMACGICYGDASRDNHGNIWHADGRSDKCDASRTVPHTVKASPAAIAILRAPKEDTSPCLRICIDDLCRGNRDNTLCGGSYCYNCDELTAGDATCDECRNCGEEDFDDEDGNYAGENEYGR